MFLKIIVIFVLIFRLGFAFEVPYSKENLETSAMKEDVWKASSENKINLMAQPMITPKPASTNTPELFVKALHDGKFVAFRLRWKDKGKNYSEKTGEFSDGVAIQFPVNGEQTTPIFMGAKGLPVHIFHWRTQFQLDKEKGKRSVKDIYPNMQMDMYPMEFADKGKIAKIDESELEKFNPAIATGNPQSYPKLRGIDEIIAEGYGTSSVRSVENGFGNGEWKDGNWTVTIVRPMIAKDASVLKTDLESYIGFAVWQGGEKEVGSRKSVTMMWTPIILKGK